MVIYRKKSKGERYCSELFYFEYIIHFTNIESLNAVPKVPSGM